MRPDAETHTVLPLISERVAYPNSQDLGLATEVAREFDVPMALASTVEQDLIGGLVSGLGDKDASVAFTLQEGRAGIKVRSD